MMPIDFTQSNFTFTKPADMTDEQCSDLPVWRGNVPHDEQGNTFPAIISCWKLQETLLLSLKLYIHDAIP